MDSLKFIKTLPQVDTNYLKEKRFSVPRKKGYELKKTIIFDLDETLIHCCDPNEKFERLIEITFPNGQICDLGINIRPFAAECLKQASKDFEVFVFTASQSCYADVVCDLLDPNRLYIHQRFYRQHCININNVLIKDLRIFQNRKLKDIIIVDNTLHCVAYQLDNCIPIIS